MYWYYLLSGENSVFRTKDAKNEIFARVFLESRGVVVGWVFFYHMRRIILDNFYVV